MDQTFLGYSRQDRSKFRQQFRPQVEKAHLFGKRFEADKPLRRNR
jgi:hypothetical protein